MSASGRNEKPVRRYSSRCACDDAVMGLGVIRSVFTVSALLVFVHFFGTHESALICASICSMILYFQLICSLLSKS